MVFDTLSNIHRYSTLAPGIARAVAFLQRTDFSRLPDGRVDIDGDRVYANLARYKTRPPEAPLLAEAHRRYIDLQCMLAGEEGVALGFAADMRIAQPYDAGRDVLFYEGETRTQPFRTGECLLLFPQDAHTVGLALAEPAPARKAVVKILLEGAAL